MFSLVNEEKGPFELVYLHFAETSRLYMWRMSFLDILNTWLLGRSVNDQLSHIAITSETTAKVWLFCTFAVIFIRESNYICYMFRNKAQLQMMCIDF